MAFENESNDTLALCMIVKNEEQNLQRCLDSVSGFIDEIVIVDTGSTDNTLSIPFKYGARVINFEWNNDFSEARNKALEYVKSDWILFMDADEVLDPKTRNYLRRAMDYDGGLANFLFVSDYINGTRIQSVQPRLFRNKKGIKYKNPICEDINESLIEISKKEKKSTRIFPVHIQHLIGEDLDKLKSKISRNLYMIEEFLKSNKLSDSEKVPYYLKIVNYQNSLQEKPEKILSALNNIHKIITSKENTYKEPIFERNVVLYNLYLLFFLIQNKKFDSAINLVENTLKTYKDSLTLYYIAYTLALEIKNIPKAIDYVNKAKEMIDTGKYNRFEPVMYDAIVLSVNQALNMIDPQKPKINSDLGFNTTLDTNGDYLPEIIELE